MRRELIARRHLPRTIESQTCRIEKRSTRHEHRPRRSRRPRRRSIAVRAAERSPLSLRRTRGQNVAPGDGGSPGRDSTPSPFGTSERKAIPTKDEPEKGVLAKGRTPSEEHLAGDALPQPAECLAGDASPQPAECLAGDAPFQSAERLTSNAPFQSSRHLGTGAPRPSRHTQPAQQREQRMFHVKHSPLNRLNNARCQRRAIGRQRKTTPPPRIAPRRGRQARQAQSRKRTRRKQQARCHTHETRTDQETAHERRTRHASAPQRPALVFHVKHQLPIRRNVVSSDEKEPWRSPDSPLCARASSHSGLRTARNCSRS